MSRSKSTAFACASGGEADASRLKPVSVAIEPAINKVERIRGLMRFLPWEEVECSTKFAPTAFLPASRRHFMSDRRLHSKGGRGGGWWGEGDGFWAKRWPISTYGMGGGRSSVADDGLSTV